MRQTLGKVARQLLHARRLGFTHPATLERVAFEAPLPADMLAVMAALDAADENAAYRPA